LAKELGESALPGVRFVPVRFTPSSSTHAGKECGGVQIIVDDWQAFDSLKNGLTLASLLKRLNPNDWRPDRYLNLLANEASFHALQRGDTPEQVIRLWAEDLKAFRARRRAYLLY
jgi:uncharacterized protein YbbC (DUF1343 family)